MSQINPKWSCTLYSGTGVHFARNTQLFVINTKGAFVSKFFALLFGVLHFLL